MDKYIKGKGVYVGTFTEKELDEFADKGGLEEVQKRTGLGYVNTEFVKEKGKIVALKVYACTLADMKI